MGAEKLRLRHGGNNIKRKSDEKVATSSKGAGRTERPCLQVCRRPTGFCTREAGSRLLTPAQKGPTQEENYSTSNSKGGGMDRPERKVSSQALDADDNVVSCRPENLESAHPARCIGRWDICNSTRCTVA